MKRNARQKMAAAVLSTTLLFGTLGAQIASAAQTAEVQSGVNFRTAPSTSANVIRMLKKGEKVSVVEQTNSYWYKITDSSGKSGYISTASQYIELLPSSGGGSQPAQPTAPATGNTNNSAAVEKVIAAGMRYLGTPYEYGSSRATTATFDCSDFVRQAFLDGVALKLPSDSRQQGAYVKANGPVKTDWRQLKRGDIMFFTSYKGTTASAYSGINKATATITHDGIYLGDGKVLHTYSQESGGVTISSIEGKHWDYRFLFGGSAL